LWRIGARGGRLDGAASVPDDRRVSAAAPTRALKDSGSRVDHPPVRGILRSAIARRSTTIDARERELAGRVGGALYIAGAIITAGVLLGTDLAVRRPGALAAIAVLGLVWGAASLWVIEWTRRSPWLLVAGTLAGLGVAGFGIWCTGGAESPLRLQVLFVVVYAAYFLSAPVAVVAAVSAAAIACAPLLVGVDQADSRIVQAGVEILTLMSVTVVMVLASTVLRRARRDAELLALQQRSLRSIATGVAREEPLPATLDRAARKAVALLDCDGASVMRFHGDRTTVMAVCTVGTAPSLAVGTTLPLRPDGEYARLRSHHEPVRVDAYPRSHRSQVARLGYGSFVAVPIVVAGEPWGALSASTIRPGGCPADAADRLADIADVIALGVSADTARRRLTDQALTDPLTGLANRRAFQERLEAEVRRAGRHGHPLTLAVMDVDGFKAINDRAGHAAGDAALVAVAAALCAATRAEDVVGRLGGDEFAVLLPEASALDAMRAIDRARPELAGTAVAGGPPVAFSAGICALAHAADVEDLLRLADTALYLAKAHGRGLSWIYDPDVAAEVSAEDRLRSRRRTDALAGLQALARAIDAKDHGTREHSARVADLAAALAARMGWAPSGWRCCTRRPWCTTSARSASPTPSCSSRGGSRRGVRAGQAPRRARRPDHRRGAHARAGRLGARPPRAHGRHGLPRRPARRRDPEGAAILAVADAFDAMTVSRPYGVPLTLEDGLRECRRAAGTQFRRDVVEALLAVHWDVAPGGRAGAGARAR
jgi:diguanylate cyclase (GGDEF)-like protein